jgi:type II secretory pathway component PulF
MYPAAVIGIVVFVAPVPALFGGAIGAGGYVLRTFLPLLLAVFVIRSGKHLWMRARDRGYPESLALFVLRLPLVGTLIRLRERVDMLGALASLLASGVAAHEAFDQSARLVRNPVLRAACKRSLVRLKLGASVADALLEAEILNVNVGYPVRLPVVWTKRCWLSHAGMMMRSSRALMTSPPGCPGSSTLLRSG